MRFWSFIGEFFLSLIVWYESTDFLSDDIREDDISAYQSNRHDTDYTAYNHHFDDDF